MNNFLAEIQAFFPGATGFTVIAPYPGLEIEPVVWVRCNETSYFTGRVLPAGNVKLSGSPEKIELARRIAVGTDWVLTR